MCFIKILLFKSRKQAHAQENLTKVTVTMTFDHNGCVAVVLKVLGFQSKKQLIGTWVLFLFQPTYLKNYN